MSELPPLVFDELVEGEHIGTMDLLVTPELNASQGVVPVDVAAGYVEPTIFGRLFVTLLRRRWSTRFAMVHASSRIECYQAVEVGVPLVVSGRLAAKQVENGRKRIVVETEVLAQATVVSRQWNTLIVEFNQPGESRDE